MLRESHRLPAGLGLANPPPPPPTLGPKASNARLILSLLSSSPPPTGVAGSEGGNGTWEADCNVVLGDGRGLPNAPPNAGTPAEGAAALDANAARAGVGSEAE